jgi:Domain of unknown function (DUF4291)
MAVDGRRTKISWVRQERIVPLLSARHKSQLTVLATSSILSAMKDKKKVTNTLEPLPYRQIRAVYDDETIRVYQAFSKEIGEAALKHQRFISPPFSLTRMTWIKPSFLWMMYRAGWGFKDELQVQILAIDIQRDGFEWALANSCISHFDPKLEVSMEAWQQRLHKSCVRVQWDPERDLNFTPLPHRSLQMGLCGEAVRRYVEEWTVRIEDQTELAHAIHGRLKSGDPTAAATLLPRERIYEIAIPD